MKIVDPEASVGVDSGLRELRVTPAEAKVLLRAAEILAEAHELIAARDPDHLGNALCTAPSALRELATYGIEL